MRSVVLLSGGMDSAVALARAVRYQGSGQVGAFGVYYGARHNAMELNAAEQLSRHYGCGWQSVELWTPWLDGTSSLMGVGELIGKPTVVPGRNAMLIALGASYAEATGAAEVVFAGHAGDRATYPDCRPAFLGPLAKALGEGTEGRVTLVCPFSGMTKAQVAEEGNRLGVPWELTYSCYAGGPEHCGTCGACAERAKALEALL